ncbi:MAG TPA: RNA methyltransferase [Macromonas sp.]|nr:RNA methyltransferase [Macromonas sp.]
MSTDIITSRDNPLFKRLRTLAQEPVAYKKQGQVWLEGDHLCRALLVRGRQPELVVHTAGMTAQVAGWNLAPTVRRVVFSDALMQQLSGLESAAPVGCLWALPHDLVLQPGVATVVLDRLQDPGNVGSILRTAAAMGFEQVVAIKGTAALWAPKVLRAGMGAHFGLHLVEGGSAEDVATLALPTLATSSHEGTWLHQARLPWPCAWLLGHEGQGVSPALQAHATQNIRIAQPGGEESLNVAAAAAICLHASATQQLT